MTSFHSICIVHTFNRAVTQYLWYTVSPSHLSYAPAIDSNSVKRIWLSGSECNGPNYKLVKE